MDPGPLTLEGCVILCCYNSMMNAYRWNSLQKRLTKHDSIIWQQARLSSELDLPFTATNFKQVQQSAMAFCFGFLKQMHNLAKERTDPKWVHDISGREKFQKGGNVLKEVSTSGLKYCQLSKTFLIFNINAHSVHSFPFWPGLSVLFMKYGAFNREGFIP